jgi:polyhydroxyalkanoate synthesis regulator phasin
VPDAVRRAVDRTFQSTVGSAGSTRERAQELVDDVLRIAEEGAARAGRGVREVGRQAEAAGVPERLREAIGDLRFATREDLRALTSEVEALSERVRQLEARLRESERGGEPAS